MAPIARRIALTAWSNAGEGGMSKLRSFAVWIFEMVGEAIKGKYRKVPTSSESFMGRKREDLALESRA